MAPDQQPSRACITCTCVLAAFPDPPGAGQACPSLPVPGCPPPCCCTSRPLSRLCPRSRAEEQIEGVSTQVASMVNFQLPALLLEEVTTFVPRPSCRCFRALERGGLSSCLRNALKMRSTEHFPNSPQFTFSTFSLGCQAFVVIFINSNCWLFPFLPGKTPPPLELATTLWQASHGAGFALLLLNTPFSPRPFHSRRPHSHCLRCGSNVTPTPVAKPLICPNCSPPHTEPTVSNMEPHVLHSPAQSHPFLVPPPRPGPRPAERPAVARAQAHSCFQAGREAGSQRRGTEPGGGPAQHGGESRRLD